MLFIPNISSANDSENLIFSQDSQGSSDFIKYLNQNGVLVDSNYALDKRLEKDDPYIINIPDGHFLSFSYSLTPRSGSSEFISFNGYEDSVFGVPKHRSVVVLTEGDLVITVPLGKGADVKDFKLYKKKTYDGYITDFNALMGQTTADISWVVKNNLPDDVILFYTDGEKKEELLVTQTTKKVTGLTPNTHYTFGLQLKTVNGDTSEIYLTSGKTLSDDISNLTYDQTHDAVTLKWDKPLHVKSGDKALIYQDGVLIKEISANQNSHTIDNLQDDTSYDFKVAIKRDNGNITEGLTVKVKTDKAPLVAAEIKNLNAVADHDRVDLSWQLPDSNGFKHVNIYRNEEVGLLKKMFGAIDPITVVHAADADNKIFETNGTYFNDLTVQPNTKYKYKLTTTTTDGQESTGVTVKVTTASTPPPVMGDNGVNLDSNGDYVIEWDSPITGDIQVKIDGQDYTTVSAANKKVIIPHADMVLDWMGHPKVQLIPISDDGTTGQATTPPVNAGPGASGGNGGSGGGTGGGNTIQTIGLPFGVDALVTSSFDLIYILGPFVLLGLALMFVPRLIKVIKKSIAERQNNKPVRF